jgi:hypothetical protein
MNAMGQSTQRDMSPGGTQDSLQGSPARNEALTSDTVLEPLSRLINAQEPEMAPRDSSAQTTTQENGTVTPTQAPAATIHELRQALQASLRNREKDRTEFALKYSEAQKANVDYQTKILLLELEVKEKQEKTNELEEKLAITELVRNELDRDIHGLQRLLKEFSTGMNEFMKNTRKNLGACAEECPNKAFESSQSPTPTVTRPQLTLSIEITVETETLVPDQGLVIQDAKNQHSTLQTTAGTLTREEKAISAGKVKNSYKTLSNTATRVLQTLNGEAKSQKKDGPSVSSEIDLLIKQGAQKAKEAHLDQNDSADAKPNSDNMNKRPYQLGDTSQPGPGSHANATINNKRPRLVSSSPSPRRNSNASASASGRYRDNSNDSYSPRLREFGPLSAGPEKPDFHVRGRAREYKPMTDTDIMDISQNGRFETAPKAGFDIRSKYNTVTCRRWRDGYCGMRNCTFAHWEV